MFATQQCFYFHRSMSRCRTRCGLNVKDDPNAIPHNIAIGLDLDPMPAKIQQVAGFQGELSTDLGIYSWCQHRHSDEGVSNKDDFFCGEMNALY